MRKQLMSREAFVAFAAIFAFIQFAHVIQAIEEVAVDEKESSGAAAPLDRDGKLQGQPNNVSLNANDTNAINGTSGKPIEEFEAELKLPGGQYLWSRNQLDYVSEGKRLSGFTFVNITGLKLVTQCAMACLRRQQRCESFNFAPGTCELSSETHVFDNGSSLVTTTGFAYYTKNTFVIDLNALGVCMNIRPCQNNGKCYESMSLDGIESFFCICTLGWKGNDCSVKAGHPIWTDYDDWSTCSATCGRLGGWRRRRRRCIDSVTSATLPITSCPADRSGEYEIQVCNVTPCPVWSEWSIWGSCVADCGRGQKHRSRLCLHGGQEGVDRMCMGMSNDTSPCRHTSCYAPLKLTESAVQGEGRVMIYDDIREVWLAICVPRSQSLDDDVNTASVICRQLGFNHRITSKVMRGGEVATDEPTLLSEVTCSGHETNVIRCKSKTWNSTCLEASYLNVRCSVDGDWSTWSEWGQCSVTCADGLRRRTRSCSKPSPMHGGVSCSGPDTQTKLCTEVECPIDGDWGTWADWQQCNTTCGGGHQLRTRVCNPPKFGGATCPGSTENRRECNTHNCPIDGVWLEWGVWQQCNATCGGGERLRVRQCDDPQFGGLPCNGSDTSFSECGMNECPIDGYWTDWSAYRDCNVTCGGGWHHRNRTCVTPLYGGEPCKGKHTQKKECNTNWCPLDGDWGHWTLWRECNATCGGGYQSRNRTCQLPQYGGADCPGDTEEQRDCNMNPCPVDGFWYEWSEWPECNVTCGGGYQNRSRVCEQPMYGGAPCNGTEYHGRACNENKCPVDGEWREWTQWSVCSVECAGGERNRSRLCNQAKFGGAECIGNYSEVEHCNTHPCPVDGIWSEWSMWTSCSVTCENGTQSRGRLCTEPKHGGEQCLGSNDQLRDCNMGECPDDSSYMSWAEWTTCNSTCGGGRRDRQRECDGQGEGCEGPPREWELCNTQFCPVDGSYDQWSAWSVCSATCDLGTRHRDRNCLPPEYGGQPCGDDLTSMENCTVVACPTDQNYGEWSGWSECAATCGTAPPQSRTRQCSSSEAWMCSGDSRELRNCTLPQCVGKAVWSEWGQWSICSVSCGGGVRRRYRSCISGFCNDTSSETSPTRCHEFSCYPLPVTCSELRTMGMHENREAEIDPTGIEPFWVYCDMSDEGQVGITEIIHNHPGVTTMLGKDKKDGDVIDFKYNVTLDQIDILVSVSLVCRQFISWQCLEAPITDHTDPKSPFLFWGNKDQVARLYWGGATDTDTQGCLCGESFECAKPQFPCNCDADDSVVRKDAGYVTSREDVPIRTFNIKATDGSWNTGNMTVGPMQCYGTDPLAVG